MQKIWEINKLKNRIPLANLLFALKCYLPDTLNNARWWTIDK